MNHLEVNTLFSTSAKAGEWQLHRVAGLKPQKEDK
jgi:hypothetical protein